jgi:hypothetical protein
MLQDRPDVIINTAKDTTSKKKYSVASGNQNAPDVMIRINHFVISIPRNE